MADHYNFGFFNFYYRLNNSYLLYYDIITCGHLLSNKCLSILTIFSSGFYWQTPHIFISLSICTSYVHISMVALKHINYIPLPNPEISNISFIICGLHVSCR